MGSIDAVDGSDRKTNGYLLAGLFERMVRVEEGLEHQRADKNARFEQMDRRFDDMHRHTNRWMTA